jgi:hypothetical protein
MVKINDKIKKLAYKREQTALYELAENVNQLVNCDENALVHKDLYLWLETTLNK